MNPKTQRDTVEEQTGLCGFTDERISRGDFRNSFVRSKYSSKTVTTQIRLSTVYLGKKESGNEPGREVLVKCIGRNSMPSLVWTIPVKSKAQISELRQAFVRARRQTTFFDKFSKDNALFSGKPLR